MLLLYILTIINLIKIFFIQRLVLQFYVLRLSSVLVLIYISGVLNKEIFYKQVFLLIK